jgi:hypothetical protein
VFHADLLQPRVGYSWDVTGDSRNLVKVSAALFAHPSVLSLPAALNTHADSIDVYLNEHYYGDWDGDGEIEERTFREGRGGPGGATVADQGDLEPSSVVEYMASYERAVGLESAIKVTLVKRDTHNIIEDVFDADKNLYVIDNWSFLKRKYRGAELRYDTRWKNVYFRGSYTWSRSRGNIEYSQGLLPDFDFEDTSVNRYGYLRDDARHNVRLNGWINLPDYFEVGYALSYNSGYPYNRLTSAEPYGQKFLEPRGSRRLPTWKQLDLEIRKRLDVNGTVLQFIGSVYNVLDSDTTMAVREFDGQSFEDPLGVQVPRRYQLGMRWVF